jgi:hypothetical protein
MTLDKLSTVTIPVWAVSFMLSLFGAGMTAWGIASATKSKLELQAEVNKNNIETLRKEKVDRNEFNIIITKLNSIESKFDLHIAK